VCELGLVPLLRRTVALHVDTCGCATELAFELGLAAELMRERREIAFFQVDETSSVL
jgi:hypothetical protein